MTESVYFSDLRTRLSRRRWLGAVGLLCSGLAMAQTESRVPRDWWVNLDNDRADAIRAALQAGADPNLRSVDGQPSIIYAVRQDAWRAFDVLAAAPNLDLEARNAADETVLMYAALTGQAERVAALLARGAAVNKLGWSPLHYAAAGGHLETVNVLLARGALVNAPAPDGTSPLMMAAQANSRDVVARLLQAGAHAGQQTEDGRTAVDFAQAQGNGRLARALQDVLQRQ